MDPTGAEDINREFASSTSIAGVDLELKLKQDDSTRIKAKDSPQSQRKSVKSGLVYIS